MNIRAGKNVWVQMDGENIINSTTSETRPEGNNWHPLYPASRIRGASYTPYTGRTQWEQAANAAMSAEARYNHEAR